MLGEPLGDGAADAARRAGDDRDAPGQVEKTGQGSLPTSDRPARRCVVREYTVRRVEVRQSTYHNRVLQIQISPSQSKPSQAKPSKIAWISLVLFVRIGTYQWVTA